MSYENAPATRLVATRCACCGRPLVDARSLECGVGPVCRRRYGFNEIAEDVRVEANRLVYEIAAWQNDPATHGKIVANLAALTVLGCTTIVEKITEGLSPVEIVTEGQDADRFGVKSPYHPAAVAAMRGVRGRRWDGAAKVNTFPRSEWPAVVALLREHYPTTMVRGATGRISATVGDSEIAPGFDVPTPEPTIEPEAPACVVRQRGNTLYVRTPYDRDAVSAMRSIRGRKYQGDGINTFPAAQRDAVMDLIAHYFPGMDVDTGEAPETTDTRPDWYGVELDAPAVEYDPRNPDHRGWLAEQLTELGDAMGFEPVQAADLPRACRELVLGRTLDNGVQLRIYTSIAGGACRREGADAVRVCAVKKDARRGRWNGVANITRVNRTGLISAIVARVHERVGDVWADVHTPAI